MNRSFKECNYLQTNQNYEHEDPVERHNSNKKFLKNIYDSIQESLVRSQKLQRLNDSQFINYYKEGHYYWDIVKYSSNENNMLNEEITKLKVSNRTFKELTPDKRQIEFDLTSSYTTYIQTRRQFEDLNGHMTTIQQIEMQHANENNHAYKNQLENIKFQNKDMFGIFTDWHYPQAALRILLLVKEEIDKDKMLIIYNKQSKEYRPITRESMTEKYLFRMADEDMADNMQELIKCHIVRQKTEKQINMFKHAFLGAIKNDFYDRIAMFLEKERNSQRKLTNNLTLVENFKYYDRLQSEDMLKRWKNKSAKHSKAKHLVIQISQIYIKTTHNIKKVSLIMQNKKDQSQENYRLEYDFSDKEGQYNVYEIPGQEQRKCSSFRLEKNMLSKDIFIRVETLDTRNAKHHFETLFSYFKLQGEDAFPHHINLKDTEEGQTDNVNQNVFIILKTQQTHRPDLYSLEQYHHRYLFDHVGNIPTKYRSTLHLTYNPNTYPIVRKLLAPQLPVKMTKQSYQQCYFILVSFIQSAENRSQMAVAHLQADKVIDKAPMKHRQAFYQREFLRRIGNSPMSSTGVSMYMDEKSRLSQDQQKILAFINALDEKIIGEICGREFMVESLQYKNLQGDLSFYRPLNQVLIQQLLVKFIHFVNKVPVIKPFPFPLRYSPHLIPILQKYIQISINARTTSQQDYSNDRIKHTVHFFTFVLFIAKLYPYSQPHMLKNDIYTLRHLVQQELPYYNDFLNREHIGLENIIVPQLLNLFSDLSEELTFRIWDFLISANDVNRARIVVAFTLLCYFETTRNLPIIPINQFMTKVIKNYNSLPNNLVPPSSLTKAAESYFSSEHSKSKRLQKLMQTKQKTIVDDKQLQKLILGDTFSNNQKQRRVQGYYKANKMVQPLQELVYPLPKPGHFGHHIQEIIIFVHNLNILENLNLIANRYRLRITVPEARGDTFYEIPIASKNHFYNESFKIPLHPLGDTAIDNEDSRNILIQVIHKSTDKRETVELTGSFNYSNFHKDKAYKIVLNLQSNNKHNKGQTIIHLSFCLKSIKHGQKLEEIYWNQLDTMSEDYLDYDMGLNNQLVGHHREMYETFDQMKNPLDEFSTEQNKRLHNAALNYHAAPWLENSKVTVEELKSIFYHLFPQQKEHDLKLEFSKIYEIFAEEHDMQYVYLSQILTKIIMSVNITRKKKITYLYCLGVHYQNAYSKKLTSQTVNSIIRLILKQQGFISPCPYDFKTSGKITEAYFFTSSNKLQEEKTDFTNILQDWAYICNYKFEYNAVILGTSNQLTLLKNLFDNSTLRKIQSQPECRFEIIYELVGRKYLWSVVIDTRTFGIIKRGTKFLNNFDGYKDLKYLDSTQEFLYNCQNVIPLQLHRSYNYSEFTKVILRNNLVRYALDMPPILVKDDKKLELVRTKDLDEYSRSSSNFYSDPKARKDKNVQIINMEEKESYDSWALNRSQNCLQSWRKCYIVNPGPILSEIKFQNDKDIYTISSLDLISMDEIDLDLAIKKQLVRLISGE